MKNGNKAENGKWSYRWGLGSTEVLFPFFSFSRFPCSFPVLVKSFCNAQTKEALSGDTTARYDLCSARPTDHLPFCVEVAKLRAKSLFLSIILLEVLFVSEWSKSNKKLLVLWSRKYLYSPHRGSLDILNGKGRGGGGVLMTKILKGKSMNLNWNFTMKGKIGGKPFKCQSSMFARTLPRNRVQVCSSPWAIYRWVQPGLFPHAVLGELGEKV